MDKRESGTYDPGWNDPPMFSYESQSAQSKVTKPRTFLNKRVAFPLQASPPTNSPLAGRVDPTAPLPPCSLSTLPPPPSSAVTLNKQIKETSILNDSFDSKTALDSVMDNFLSLLDSNKFEEKQKCEIKRRLETMRKMWTEEKLSQDVQQRLLLLSDELKRDEVEKADEVHKGLMVDHAAACSTWMSGVRHLIHSKQTTSDTSSTVTAD